MPSRARRVGVIRTSTVLSAAIINVALLRFYERGMYRDEPVDKLVETVKVGPFSGLRTTAGRARVLEAITRAIRAHAEPDARILSYYDFPAAYLMADMRPAVPSVWTDARIGTAPVMMDYYRRHLTGRGLVLRWTAAGGNHTGITALERLAESPDRVLARGSGFVLYREPAPEPAPPH
jgi:hypothetical protein